MKKRILIVVILMIAVIPAYSGVKHLTEKKEPEQRQTEPVRQLDAISVEDLNSQHGIVMDLERSQVLYEKAAEDQTRPASLAKMMTAIVIIEHTTDFSEKVAVPHDVYTDLNGRGIALAGFEDGEAISVMDHLYGILYLSGAECCVTMAEKVAGSEEAFVELMNQKALELGMDHTTFGNAIGLDSPACYTTARDMATLLQYALKNKQFRQVFASYAYTLEPTNKCERSRTIHNRAIARFEPDRAGVIGGKLGNTPEAALCLASLAEIQGKEYICITTYALPEESRQDPHVEDARNIYQEIDKALSTLNKNQ